jgi:hypothetical protein
MTASSPTLGMIETRVDGLARHMRSLTILRHALLGDIGLGHEP